MTQKILLCDVDGVIADFTQSLLRTINSSVAYGEIVAWDLFSLLPPHEKRVALDVLKDPKWWANQPTIYKAQRSIEELRKNNWDVVFVTSPWLDCKEWAYTRTQWLKTNFDAPATNVIIAARKELFVGDAFVDDRDENVQKVLNSGHVPNVMIYDAPYNAAFKAAAIRVVNWDDILGRLVVQ